MRAVTKILFFMLLLNTSAYLIAGINVMPEYQMLTPFNETQVVEGYNASEIVESWDWTEEQGLFGDVQSGLLYLWNFNIPFIEAFFSMLQAWGVDAIFLAWIRIPWRFLWVMFVVEFISGRKVLGD